MGYWEYRFGGMVNAELLSMSQSEIPSCPGFHSQDNWSTSKCIAVTQHIVSWLHICYTHFA